MRRVVGESTPGVTRFERFEGAGSERGFAACCDIRKAHARSVGGVTRPYLDDDPGRVDRSGTGALPGVLGAPLVPRPSAGTRRTRETRVSLPVQGPRRRPTSERIWS